MKKLRMYYLILGTKPYHKEVSSTEEAKNRLCFGVTYSKDIQVVCEALNDGTPLPKGHGRIADVNKMLDEMRATRTYDILFALERVKPIIEADKEGER